MTIHIWQSFSCNNSSSYRLVARFADATEARDVARELGAFFAAHAQEMDAAMEAGDFPDESPASAQALATKYGFAWKEVLAWGDEGLAGDEPSIAAEGEVLVAYHTYCGGFGDAIPTYLKKRGATVEPQTRSAPPASILFALPAPSKELDRELAEMFAQIDGQEERLVEPFQTPWKTRWECYGTAAFFRDAKTVGLYFPIAPTDLPACKAWLASHGIDKPSIRLCEYDDEDKFVAIAAARCTSCDGALEYLDQRLHDIDSEQLACHGCGGLYDLATFTDEPEPKT
jgi:hypothetical protein